jgi:autotransporter-associated beta strand protein
LNGSADNSTGAVVLSTYWASAIVTISGGGGSGATAVVTGTKGGAITGITVTNGGTGYTSAPTVAIASTTGGSGAAATATISGGAVTAINVTAGGTLYVPTTALPILSTNAAYYSVVSNAGPLPHDQVDSQVVGNVTSLGHSGGLWTSQTATGLTNDGYGAIAGGVPPVDSDQDGMPDDWETAKGLNPNSAADGNAISASGYTNVEDYINWMAQPHAYMAKNTTSQPTSVTIDLSQYAAAFPTGSTYTVSGVTGGTVTQSGTGGYLAKFVPTLNTGPIIAGFTFTITSGSNSISNTCGILVSANALPNDLLWDGNGTTNPWDTTTTDWTNQSTSAPIAYSGGDTVTFDDTGSASPVINVTGVLAPGAMTVDSNTNNYTLSGTGSLAGTGSLVKDGNSTLTINVASTRSGNVSIDAGTVVLGNNLGSLGTGSVDINGTVTNAWDSSGGQSGGIAGGIVVDGGNTATINMGARSSYSGALTGSGSITFNAQSTISRNDIAGTYGAFTGTINFTGNGGIRLLANGGTFGGFDNATINLGVNPTDSLSLQPHTNSGGNTFNVGSLTGTSATAVLGGGSAGSPTWVIGGLNTSTTFPGQITGNAIVTKTGSGTLTLTGSSSYTGATNVNAGTLQMNGTLGATAVTVASGATLGVNGSIGGLVTVNSGGYLYLGNSTTAGVVGTLTGTAGFTLAGGGTIVFDLSSSPTGTNDQITLNSATSSNLTFSGTTNFKVNLTDGSLGAGTYNLINGNATQQGSTTLNLILPVPAGTTRQSINLARPSGGTKPGYLNLIVTGTAGSLVWTGANGAVWDLNTTANNFSGSSPTTFYNLDGVTFDDTSSIGAITLTGTLSPGVITFNNNNTAYTFSGSGLIGGGTQIIKNGTGTVTFSNTPLNTFTGNITLNAGTFNAYQYMGFGVIYMNGGTLALGSSVLLSNSVVVNSTSTIYAGRGSTDFQGSLSSGTNGVTLYLGIGSGNTFSIGGDMSGFTGTIELGTSTGELRLNYSGSANTGSPSALFDLGTSAYLGNRNGGVTINLGGLSGGAGSTLLGRTSGGGTTATNYVIGALNTDTTFAGTIETGGDQLGTNITKVGTGNLTLSGTSTWLGIVTVQAGTLTVSGTMDNGGSDFETQTGATLNLSGGTITTPTVQIDSGATMTGCGTINGDLQIDGTLASSCGGTIAVSGDVTVNGTMRLTNSTAITVGGTFTNNGVLDILTGSQTLPANFVNNGVVLDSREVEDQALTLSGSNVVVTVVGYTGHNYQLQRSDSLNPENWTNIGAAQAGGGNTLTFTDVGGVSGTQRYYRVILSP